MSAAIRPMSAAIVVGFALVACGAAPDSEHPERSTARLALEMDPADLAPVGDPNPCRWCYCAVAGGAGWRDANNAVCLSEGYCSTNNVAQCSGTWSYIIPADQNWAGETCNGYAAPACPTTNTFLPVTGTWACGGVTTNCH
jgi:hypothetical protein